jgi:hypothetical protein
MASKKTTADLDKTISILQEDLTSVPAEEAIAIIENWQKQLAGTDIAEELDELKSILADGGDDSEVLSSLLADLGEDTIAMADSDDINEDVATKIEQLGELLSQMSDSAA